MFRAIAQASVVVAVFLMSGSAKADDPNCLVTLFKTSIDDKVDKDNYLFLIDQVEEQHYYKVQNDLNIMVPGYFNGSWSQFKEKRDALKKNYQITTSEKYSRQYIISTLTPDGVAAYTACLRALRGQTQLSLYPAKTQYNDNAITFTVDLKAPAQLAGPARIEIFGAKRLLSAPGANDRVSTSPGVVHIAVSNLQNFRTFSVEREGPKKPVKITAEMSGLVADPVLEFGPVLKQVTKFVDVPLAPVEDTIQFLARRLEPGTNRADLRWAYPALGSGGDATNQQFVGNMCICASGKRQQSDDFHSAGRCIPRTNSDDNILPNTVRLSTPGLDVTKPYLCGSPGQPQEPVSVAEAAESGDGYCFALSQSLNIPPEGSSQCQVHFRISGMMRTKRVVFEEQ